MQQKLAENIFTKHQDYKEDSTRERKLIDDKTLYMITSKHVIMHLLNSFHNILSKNIQL